jgi:MFS family permease
MVSLQNIGAFFAALGISLVSARFGRKRTIMASCAVFVLGVILQVIPSHALPCFYIGRFVSGLGLGAATAVAPSYNAEMAPKEIRGQLGSGMQWLFALGVMISYWIDYGVAIGMEESSAQWQIPVGLQMVPAAVLGFGLIGFPESVRWLVKKERYDEAWESLSWMRADTGMFFLLWRRSDRVHGLIDADVFVLQVPKSRPSLLRSELVLPRKCVRAKASKVASCSSRPTRSVWLSLLVSSLVSNRPE